MNLNWNYVYLSKLILDGKNCTLIFDNSNIDSLEITKFSVILKLNNTADDKHNIKALLDYDISPFDYLIHNRPLQSMTLLYSNNTIRKFIFDTHTYEIDPEDCKEGCDTTQCFQDIFVENNYVVLVIKNSQEVYL